MKRLLSPLLLLALAGCFLKTPTKCKGVVGLVDIPEDKDAAQADFLTVCPKDYHLAVEPFTSRLRDYTEWHTYCECNQ